ncbi:MAG: hypothetical protein ACE5FG_11970 [Myxococcota bacterium]
MARIAREILIAIGATVMAALLAVTPAEADTCESACNQIRRACTRLALVGEKAAQAVCDETRDLCRVDCVTAGPDVCLTDCDASHVTCTSACATDPNPVWCQAGCDAELANCSFACLNCKASCNQARAACRDEAHGVRDAAKLVCATAREDCPGLCVEPIDEACVRQCKVTRKSCGHDEQGFYGVCKRACARGTEKRACVRGCRKQYYAALGICADQEALCVGGCIGLTP